MSYILLPKINMDINEFRFKLIYNISKSKTNNIDKIFKSKNILIGSALFLLILLIILFILI